MNQILANRRGFLTSVAGTAAATLLPSVLGGGRLYAARREKLPVAAIVTMYGPHSHADVILGKIMEGWQQDGGEGPDLKLVSLYVEQVGADDLSRKLAARHNVRLANTIAEAVTLGTQRVPVAGVLSIGEHGKYPLTPDTRQKMYPRRRFFEQIVAAFERGGKVVPIFNDKHLAYRWEDAKFMYETARQRRIPFLAGSSVPVAWRLPPLEIDRQDELEYALTIGWDGLEIYGFHALELHQAMIERRRGGETGIVAVQALRGRAIRRTFQEQPWVKSLFESALAKLPPRPSLKSDWTAQKDAALFLLEHQDGLKSAIAMTGSMTTEFAFAARVKDRAAPVSTWVHLPDKPPFGHFAHLLKAIEETIHSGRAVFPIERTLLTTGTLDRLLHSVAQNSKRFDTPELAITYQPSDWPYANHPKARLDLPLPGKVHQ